MYESLRSEDLNRSLWRTVGVSVLRKFFGFHCLRLQELQKMIHNAEFVDVMQEGVGESTTQIEYKVCGVCLGERKERHRGEITRTLVWL